MKKRFAQLLLILSILSAAPGAFAQGRQASPATLQEGAPGPVYRDWTVFFHPRFGYELPVPPGVGARHRRPEAAAVAEFVSWDGAFVMSAWGGLSPVDPEDLMRAEWRRAQSRPGRDITYERRGRSWFVVYGTDRGGVEFYEKFTMRGDHVAQLTLTFPRARLRKFEGWVEEIEDGFRVVALSGGPPETAPLPAAPGGSAKAKVNPGIDLTPPPPAKPGTAAAAPQRKTKRAPADTNTPKPAAPERPADAEADEKPAGKNPPFGRRVAGKPGFVYSPFASGKSLVDVTGIPPGTRVECPYTKKHFRVP